MSVVGLQRKGTFEEVLAAAIKDDQGPGPGTIGPGLQRAATRLINSPDFQRVKDGLENDLKDQQTKHIEQQAFQNSIAGLSVDARVPQVRA